MRVSPYFNADHGKPLQQMQAPRHRIGAWSFPKAQDEPLGLAGVVLQGACEIPMLPQAHQRAPLLPGCWHGQGRQGKLRAGRGTHIVCEEPGQERPTHRETRRRRSTHARIRQTEGRPTGAAFHDAQRARQANVFMQPDGRYVVRGDRGREHIFGADGIHITIVRHSHSAHERKRTRNECRPISPEEFARF